MDMSSYQVFRKVLAWQQTDRVIQANDMMINRILGEGGTAMGLTSDGHSQGYSPIKGEKEIAQLKKIHRESLRRAEAYANSAHIFEVSDKQKHLLMLTRPMKITPTIFREIRLPFPEIFIDVSLEAEEGNRIEGILIKEINYINHTAEEGIITTKTKPTLTAFICTFSKTQSIMELSLEFDDLKKMKRSEKQILQDEVITHLTELVQKFVFNFLCFLNDPEVVYIERKRDTNTNQRRMKQGKMPLPDSNVIQLKGQIKRYIDSIPDYSFKGALSYRFWVRGHFRNLRAARYKEKKIIFIPPFQKGSGVLVPQRYRVEKEGDRKTLYYDDIDPSSQSEKGER